MSSRSLRKYRADIDGLRAVAVWLVVLFHAFPSWASGGFIGVDVFFVISGYLITGILLNDLNNDKFSISHFYSRRIRRIFPALIVILIAALVVGERVLVAPEYQQLGRHVMAGMGFFANLTFYGEAGYFDQLSVMKPLLHLWSLAIEEQFYIFWPLILFGLWKCTARRKAFFFCAIISLIFASFLTNIYLSETSPPADYYWTIARAWELLAGGLIAFVGHNTLQVCESQAIRGYAGEVAVSVGLLMLIIGAYLIAKDSSFPGWWSLLPVVGTALIVATPTSFVQRTILSHPLLIWFGLISYPLYLWHWPILSYLKILSGGRGLEIQTSLMAISASVLLAWLTYEFVEKPVRFKTGGVKLKVGGLIGFAVLIAAIGRSIDVENGFPGREVNQHAVKFLNSIHWVWNESDGCQTIYGDVPLSPFCFANSQDPQVFFLGDSHANQLVPGLVDKFGLISAGNGAPTDGVAIKVEKMDHSWNRNLESWEKDKAFLLRKAGKIKVVIISAQWEALTTGSQLADIQNEEFGRISLTSTHPGEAGLSRLDLLERSLLRTISFIEQTGAKVVLVIDPPEISFLSVGCFRQNLLWSRACPSSISRSFVLDRQKGIREVFARIREKDPRVQIYDPTNLFCDDKLCYYFDNDGFPLYRDFTHITSAMSMRIGASLSALVNLLLISNKTPPAVAKKEGMQTLDPGR